jgi:hypothetical protein
LLETSRGVSATFPYSATTYSLTAISRATVFRPAGFEKPTHTLPSGAAEPLGRKRNCAADCRQGKLWQVVATRIDSQNGWLRAVNDAIFRLVGDFNEPCCHFIAPLDCSSTDLPDDVGTLLPDKVEAIADVWADGETFGQPDWVKVILTNREAEASANEQAAALLQEGLDQNWSREQYLKAAGETRNSGPIAVLRCALLANRNADKPRFLRHLIQNLWDTFTGESVQIRTAKPPLTAASSSKSSQATVRAYSSSIFKQFRPAGVPPRRPLHYLLDRVFWY